MSKPKRVRKPEPGPQPPQRLSSSPRGERVALIALLAVFGIIAAMWALFIPVPAQSVDAATWDGYNPDEQIHLQYIAYVATHFSLPHFGGAPEQGGSIYTAIHPPLYYVAGAIVYTASIKVMAYADTVLLLRLLSSLCGVATVLLTYRTARYLLPRNTALLAAGCVAGVPMFISLSATVSNEVPAAMMSAGALCTMVRGFRYGFNRRAIIVLSLWVAAGLLTKITCFVLVPTAVLAILLQPRLARAGNAMVRGHLATFLGICVVSIGGWLLRNQLLYGDPLMAAIHYRHWSQAVTLPWQKMMTVPQFFWNAATLGWLSFWGVFDAFSRPMPSAVFLLLLCIQVLSVIGFALFLVRHGLRQRVWRRTAITAGLFAVLLIAVFYAVNARIYAPQGRYLFPILSLFGIVTAVGWNALVPARMRGVWTAALLVVLLLINLFAVTVMSVRPRSAAASRTPSACIAASHRVAHPSRT